MDTLPHSVHKDNLHYVIIPLIRDKSAMVSIEDADLAEWHWIVTSHNYAVRHSSINKVRTTYAMHQIVLERKLGRPIQSGMLPDHINGNRLDNRRANLREATPSQNMLNKAAYKSHGYKGIHFQRRINKWEARIMVGETSIFLGFYQSSEEAALAYDQAAIECFGAFARLNYPLEYVRSAAPPLRAFDKPNISGFIGVRQQINIWQARIRHNGKERYLGSFDTPDEAALAYDKAALELYGRFTTLNHPIEQILAWNPPPPTILRKSNVSNFMGVSKYRRRWKAQIKVNYIGRHLGYFGSPEEAARAYDRAAIEAYGKSAKLNFPQERDENG